MPRKILIAVGLALALLIAAAATAYALTIRAGDIVIDAEGGFSPTALPKTENAPITPKPPSLRSPVAPASRSPAT